MTEEAAELLRLDDVISTRPAVAGRVKCGAFSSKMLSSQLPEIPSKNKTEVISTLAAWVNRTILYHTCFYHALSHFKL